VNWHWFIGPALILLFSAGCSEVQQSATSIPVTGTVTLNAKPLEGASISFIPLSSNQSQGGIGNTDAAGNYEVTHFRTGKGLEPGEYRVVISKLVTQDGSPIPAGQSAADVATKDALPPHYSDQDASTLKATVAAGGKPINFDLTSP
jgi:hypothetical protein